MPEKPETKHESGFVIRVIDEGRVVGFSDAVFAFAITLLVIKLDLPQVQHEIASTHLLKALLDLWPQYLSNIISFTVIGMFWVAHHRLLSAVKRYDMVFIWLNMALLMGISFIPFPTDLLGEYGDTHVAVAFYYLTLTLVGLIQYTLWFYASHGRKLISPHFSSAHIRLYTVRSFILPIVFGFSFLLTFVDLTLATYSWLLVFVVSFVFSRYWQKKYHLPNY